MTLRKALVQPRQLTLEKRQAINVTSLRNGKIRLDQVKVLVPVLVLEKTVRGTTKPNVVGVDALAIQEINALQKKRHATNVVSLATLQQYVGVADPKHSQEADPEAVQEAVEASRLHKVKMELGSVQVESRWTGTTPNSKSDVVGSQHVP